MMISESRTGGSTILVGRHTYQNSSTVSIPEPPQMLPIGRCNVRSMSTEEIGAIEEVCVR